MVFLHFNLINPTFFFYILQITKFFLRFLPFLLIIRTVFLPYSIDSYVSYGFFRIFLRFFIPYRTDT